MLLPDDLHKKILRTFQRQCRQWLCEEGQWPLIYKLGRMTEKEANKHTHNVLAWINAWQNWQGVGEVVWQEKSWHELGKQRLPCEFILYHPKEVAAWLGESARWEKMVARYKSLTEKWPVLRECLSRYIEILADYPLEDFERIEKVLSWIMANPASNLYPRQLPIPGVDTKWLERRKELINDLVGTLHANADDKSDFYNRCGLKRMPELMRLRLLDESLRSALGGLSDFSATLSDIACLNLPIKKVYIVENLQTGLSIGDTLGSVAIMGLGYNVDKLNALPWLRGVQCFYWGDIDTHGLAILHRARSYLPHLEAILMDEQTLHDHQPLWERENQQHGALELPLLKPEEQALYTALKQQRWGENVRLEQERIDWDYAWERICGSS